ncbi:MAG TPA: glutathione S-transferase C-terminal domain-containing protein [Duganella sp.]
MLNTKPNCQVKTFFDKVNYLGEHCRKEAVAHAALVNKHLSDGRKWLLGGDEPTFADITLAKAIAFSKFR